MRAFPPQPLGLAFAAVLAGCAFFEDGGIPEAQFERPETAVEYRVRLEGVEDERARDLMREALAVFRRQEDGAQSVAFLRRRAEGDVETALKILRSFGYYEAEVEVRVEAPDAAPPPEAEAPVAESEADAEAAEAPEDEEPEDDADESRATVRVIVEQNRAYMLAAHRLLYEGGGDAVDGLPAVADAKEFGSPVGRRARASRILSAEDKAVAALRAGGRPYARRLGRDAVADPEAATLEVDTTIAPGRAYVYGDVVYEGLGTIDTDYLDTYRTFDLGASVDPADLVAFQRELISTGLFNAGSANFPEEPPEGEAAPVIVTLEEAPPRTISGGVRFDTDVGPAVRGGFEHRNLFGANETLTLEALVGLEEQSLDTRYRLPQFLRSGQDLVYGLEIRRIDDEAFEEIGGAASVGIERELSPGLLVGLGVLG
ncbi:MAG: POTRA domain-containing protein, partial [Pseudomonadota bacterium]